MALITRVSRLFQADFHAVLDRIEDPEALLRQAVREMEEELAHDEQRSGHCISNPAFVIDNCDGRQRVRHRPAGARVNCM